MSIPFTSSKHFLNETMALAEHIKPMKVSALRLAMAKREGHSTVQSYLAQLDSVPSTERSEADSIDFNTYIRRHGNLLVFQAQTILDVDNYLNIEEWNDKVESYLIGTFGLQGASQNIIDGTRYVSGYIDLNDDALDSEDIATAVEHFTKTQSDVNWGAPGVAAELLGRIKGVFLNCGQGYTTRLTKIFQHAFDTDTPLEPKDFDVVMWQLLNSKVGYFIPFGDDMIANTRGIFENTNRAENTFLKLKHRAMCMLGTLVHLVLTDLPDTYLTAKDFVSGMNGMRNLDRYLTTAFFTGQIYTYDEDGSIDAISFPNT